MRFVAVIADRWEQLVTVYANHGFYFNVKLGTAIREGKPRTCLVFIDAHDQSFTREKTQGFVFDGMRNLSSNADADVIAAVSSRVREKPHKRAA
jgi:hypothetical protein